MSKSKDKEKKDPVEVARADEGVMVSKVVNDKVVGKNKSDTVVKDEVVGKAEANAVVQEIAGQVDEGVKVDKAGNAVKYADGKGTLTETETLVERKSTEKLATSSTVEKSPSVTDVGLELQQRRHLKEKLEKLLESFAKEDTVERSSCPSEASLEVAKQMIDHVVIVKPNHIEKVGRPEANTVNFDIEKEEQELIESDLEEAVHHSQVTYLECLRDAIDDAEFEKSLADKCVQSAPASWEKDAVEITKNEVKRKSTNGSWKRAVEAAARKNARKSSASAQAAEIPKYDISKDTWFTGAANIETRELSDIEVWWERHCNDSKSPFYGRGYGLTIEQAMASRSLLASRASTTSKRLSGSEARKLRRESQLVEGEDEFLAFKVSSEGNVNCAVVSEREFEAAIDSGTTISLKNEEFVEQLTEFDPEWKVKIMGFNGSVTSSEGKGTLVGYATSQDGRKVPIYIPGINVVRGAPNTLLSVSCLVKLGFEFHFTKKKSWIITPSLDVINLEQRGGLYWLRYKQLVEPQETNTAAKAQKEENALGAEESVLESDIVNCYFVEESSSELNAQPKVEDTRKLTTEVSAAAESEVDKSAEQLVLLETCKCVECEWCNAAVKEKVKTISSDLLHRRFMHMSHTTLRQMVKNKSLDFVLTDFKEHECDICKANKVTKGTVPDSREEDKADEMKPFSHVTSDVKGKMLPDFFGNQYLVTFTCELTRWTNVYFCKNKSQVKDKFKEYLLWVERQGNKVKVLTTDGGGEYTANENAQILSEFQKICADKLNNIEHRMTSPNTAAQNGISERLNRTLITAAKSILHDAALSREFWTLAVRHVVWMKNRVWHSKLRLPGGVGISPFQAVYGRPPRVSMIRVFGCDSWALDLTLPKGSLQPKGKKMIYVGQSAQRKGWLLFDPRTRKLRTTFHCNFDETLEGRRCALRDFNLRPRKAGEGATRDEERLALLEGELYEEEDKIDIVEDVDADFHEAVNKDKAPNLSPVNTTGQSENSKKMGKVVPQSESDSESESDGEADEDKTTVEIKAQKQTIAKESGMQVPKRRAAIGTPQKLSEDESEFLSYAFKNNLPVQLQDKNPKKPDTKSRHRYEKYKKARTLREITNLGGSWDDIVWDYERGYIDFNLIAGFSDLQEFENQKLAQGIAVSSAATINSSFNVTTNGVCGELTVHESLQQDYAALAWEHIQTLSHRTQRYLQRALGKQTLVEFAHCCASRIVIPEPLTVAEAMASEHKDEWLAAMDEEIANLSKFGCFEAVPRSEALKHGRLVKSKWVFKVKFNADGTVQRFRARLVGKGFTQVPGSDFYETYSPVFSYTSLRTIMAIAAEKDLQIDQWDLKNGFLQQDIDVDHMYIEPPAGYSKVLPDGRPAALHCLKSLYGLRQSSRLLHERLSKFLLSIGFKQLISDKCVYTRGEGDNQAIVCCWVDDIILASPKANDKMRTDFDAALRSVFEMSPWTSGEAGWLLNIKITRNWESGTLHISQPAAIEKLALQFKLTGVEKRAPWVPMDPQLKLSKPAPDKIIPASVFDYQSAVGGLLYLSLTARPDIAQSVGVLSRFMSCPAIEHIEAAKQVIRYAYATKEYGITFTRGKSEAPHVYMRGEYGEAVKFEGQDLVTYADADLAGDINTRKSTTGYAILMSGGLICWMSKLQSTIALSTSEAETNSTCDVMKQLIHTRLFLQELGMQQEGPSVVYEDNAAAVAIVQSPEQSKKAKHFQIKVAFLTDQFKRGVFEYKKCSTKDQLADVFTKPLPRDLFIKFRSWMGVLLPKDD